MASQHSGHEFEQTQGDSEGQESLACCSSWGRKKFSQKQLNSHNKKVEIEQPDQPQWQCKPGRDYWSQKITWRLCYQLSLGLKKIFFCFNFLLYFNKIIRGKL